MQLLRLLTFILLLAPLCAGANPVRYAFGGDKVEVLLPDDYSISIDETGKLTARFGDDASHVIELVFRNYTSKGGAELALRKFCQQKGLPLSNVDGKLLVIDPDRDVTRDGVVYRKAHWRIAFARSLVVLTLTAPAQRPMSSALADFFHGTLDELIASLERTRD